MQPVFTIDTLYSVIYTVLHAHYARVFSHFQTVVEKKFTIPFYSQIVFIKNLFMLLKIVRCEIFKGNLEWDYHQWRNCHKANELLLNIDFNVGGHKKSLSKGRNANKL